MTLRAGPGTLVGVSTGDPGFPPERIGSTLRGKWTLEKLLGEGGMASVYVARHKIGRLEAIKIMHPFVAASPELRARFEQEARLANRFHHAGAVEIRDIDTTEDGAPFLVMELLEGETLSAIARQSKEPLDVATVLRVADEVLDVLAAAHATGIIHRDIKPDNLLMTKEGRVKVLDFGIARLREGLSRDVKTHTGTTLGTVAYMAPEQAKGGEIDARADIYAMGATMFRLLAGRRVHEADTEAERLAKLMSGTAEPLGTVAPRVPSAVCAIVDRALAFDRTKRYPDAGAMQADVRAAAKGVPVPDAHVASAPAAEAPASLPEPTREATTRVERAPVEEATKREGPAPADDVATVKTDSARTRELLRTERMPGAPVRPAPGARPARARPHLLPRNVASVFAPQNRLLLLLLVGGGVALVLLLVVTVVLALRQPPDADAPESPAASDSAGAVTSPAAPAAGSAPETAPSHAPTHALPPSKGKPRGH